MNEEDENIDWDWGRGEEVMLLKLKSAQEEGGRANGREEEGEEVKSRRMRREERGRG